MNDFLLYRITVRISSCLIWFHSSTRHDSCNLKKLFRPLYKGDPSAVKERSDEESQEHRTRRHGMVLTWLISQRQQTSQVPEEVSRANITSCHPAFCNWKTTVSSSSKPLLLACVRAPWFPLTWRCTSPLQAKRINWGVMMLYRLSCFCDVFLGTIFCYLCCLLAWLDFRNSVYGTHFSPFVDSCVCIIYIVYILWLP
jgi:hypothetical protein